MLSLGMRMVILSSTTASVSDLQAQITFHTPSDKDLQAHSSSSLHSSANRTCINPSLLGRMHPP